MKFKREQQAAFLSKIKIKPSLVLDLRSEAVKSDLTDREQQKDSASQTYHTHAETSAVVNSTCRKRHDIQDILMDSTSKEKCKRTELNIVISTLMTDILLQRLPMNYLFTSY